MLTLELCSVGQIDHLFSYSEVKMLFRKLISYHFSDFSKDELFLAATLKLYPIYSVVLGDLDLLSLDNEHFLLYL